MCETFQSYKWDNNEAVVQWIEGQLEKPSRESIITHNLHCVKKDAVINLIKNTLDDCPDAALDAVVSIIEKLNDNQKAEVIRTLSHLGSVENLD